MVERRIILAGIILLLTLPSVSGCSALLPPLLGPMGAGNSSSNSKTIERIHSKGLEAASTTKTDKQLEVVEGITKRAMDKASVPGAYDPYQPSLAEKIAYTTQFAGKAIEKTAPVFPLAPVVGGRGNTAGQSGGHRARMGPADEIQENAGTGRKG